MAPKSKKAVNTKAVNKKNWSEYQKSVLFAVEKVIDTGKFFIISTGKLGETSQNTIAANNLNVIDIAFEICKLTKEQPNFATADKVLSLVQQIFKKG